MEMGVVSGSGEDAKAKSCSSEIEAAEKTLKDDDVQENGIRVSENGDKKSNDVEQTKEKVVETGNLNESGEIEDCMMNGVSSLLKLKQDVSDMENPQVEKKIFEEEEVKEEEEEVEDEDEEEEDEDDEEEEHGYCVGDFVWGKIKNHPWWPGQIYDQSDASDLALKIKQKGKLLVAYFGDGTFAWCGASQLKPFAENFKECSMISSSRSFLGAVEEAVEEMGRHIDRLLICECVKEKNHNLDNPEVNNAGIKEGVLVRKVRREMISTLLCGKHGEILERVKCFAETVSFSCLLELEILKRKVSAFYRSKRGYGLIEYHEPQSVPGLEDKNNDDDGDNEGGAKWRAKRSTIEKAPGLVPKESPQRSLVKCSAFPDHRLHHRRKQKSIAELLETESSAKVRFEIEPVNGAVKSSRKKTKRSEVNDELENGNTSKSMSRKKSEVNDELENGNTSKSMRRKKSDVSTFEDAGHKQVEGSSKGKTLRKRKKKDDDDDDAGGDRVETEKNETRNPEVDIDSTPLASLRKRVTVGASSVEKNVGNGENATPTPKRERKKSKYLSPDYLLDFSRKGRKITKLESESLKVPSQSQVGAQMTDATDGVVAVEKDKFDNPREPSIDNGLGCEELSLRNAADFLRLGATANEMKELIRIAALGTEYPKDSSARDMVREFMSIYRSFTYHDGANHKFMKDYNNSDKEKELTVTAKLETKGIEKKNKKQETKQNTEEKEETDKHETGKKENFESKKLAGEGEETRKQSSESTKEKRKRKKPKKQGDAEEETREKLSESTKKERKRKEPESKKQAEADEKEETRKESSETTKKERKVKKAKLELLDKENFQKENVEGSEKKKRERKSKKKETEKDHSGAELYVTFGPGSSLPKKDDLIEIYEKFGALDKGRTDMCYDKFYACVAFLSVADGEKAFESSQEICPFASNQNVKFRLKYPNEKSSEKKTEDEVAETRIGMNYLKKKLEEMKMLLDESAGRMTEEVKVKIVDEMENVLEKVRKM